MNEGFGKRVKLALKALNEAKEYITKKDPVQSSEKLYKASEESLKAMAYELNLEAARAAKAKGRWTTDLLFDAATVITEKLGEDVVHWWDSAWVLHVEGFHETKLSVEHVNARIRDVERMVSLAKRVREGRTRRHTTTEDL